MTLSFLAANDFGAISRTIFVPMREWIRLEIQEMLWASLKVSFEKKYLSLYKGCLDSQVVFTLDYWTTVHCALGREFEPRWRQTLFRTHAQHLCFIHNSVWFVWFDTIICLSNLSCELWSRKLKIKEIYLKKNLSLYSWSHVWLVWIK